MSKYISIYNLANHTKLSTDELCARIECGITDKITEAQIRESNLWVDELTDYFGVAEDKLFQSDLFGGIKPVKKSVKKVEKVIPERVWEADDYLPNLEESLNYQYEFLDLSQTITEPLACDTEIYGNYFLVMFYGVESHKCWFFECTDLADLDRDGLRWFLQNHLIVTFNGIKFDLPIIQIALNESSTISDLCEATRQLIDDENNLQHWHVVKKFKGIKLENVNHIDLIEVAKGQASLKQYGARLGCGTIQDLPFKPLIDLDSNRMAIIRKYCLNDTNVTALLYDFLIPAIELRERIGKPYNLDLRSKKEAQCAAAVIIKRVEGITGRTVHKDMTRYDSLKYNVPDYIKFDTPELQNILESIRNAEFPIVNDKIQGDVLEDVIVVFGDTKIAMGIGGIHSQESNISHYSNDEYMLVDVDAASQYPNMMIKMGLYPHALGQAFTKVFPSLVKERLVAKANKDKVTDAGLKLLINSTFGLTGNRYSPLYSPQLLIQTTITGQLCLIMLAEQANKVGFSITSGNTDGLTIKLKHSEFHILESIVKDWEQQVGLNMEYTFYKSTHSASVNNYFAITDDGKVKRKGLYAEFELDKNTANLVCSDAVANYLKDRTDIVQSVLGCKDVKKFLTIKKVAHGGVKDGEFLGKTVRFYHSNNTDTAIYCAKTGNTVGTSDRCRPMQKLMKELPMDLDYDFYIDECYRILKDIGADK